MPSLSAAGWPFIGTWSASVFYSRGDVVLRSGALYQARTDVLGDYDPAIGGHEPWFVVGDIIMTLRGSADPTAGSGIPAAIGTSYAQVGTGAYLKTGAGATAWTSLGGGGGGGVSVGFAWHWYLGAGQVVTPGIDAWRSTAEVPTIDADPQGFYDADEFGPIVPTGYAGVYEVFVTASFQSGAATGYVALDASGTSFQQATPILQSDNVTVMYAAWRALVDLSDGDNLLDVQHFINLSDHDVTLRRVDVRVQRVAATLTS